MPPSRHSSSSHSSRSSSSRSFSSRSSSRSSGSSSRSPSAHSSSSYSSGPSRSSFSSPFRGPSAHSVSSMGSAAASGDWRPRVNQPTGFVTATRMRPTYYYGKRHSYAYFPMPWTDTETGVSYEKGYYDENGRRYDDVTFEENGSYKNVVCHCPYCEQDTILDLGAGDVAARSLKCPHCGGPMEIRSELDAILNETPENTHVYQAEESLNSAFPKKKKKRGWIVFLILMMLYGYGRSLLEKQEVQPGGQLQQINVVQNSGQSNSAANAVYLEKQADGSYHVVLDVLRSDKILYFDREADSYYDETTDCWAWKNTDVSPAVWQYWYEGISSDYGDYGWMEHDASGWYIEEAQGRWVPLPSKYDTEKLWYIG